MAGFLRNYFVIAGAGILGVLLALGGLALGSLVRPKSPKLEDRTTYESGVEPLGEVLAQSHYVRYYLYALLFLVFDIEVAFIIPWAVQVDVFGFYGLAEMFVFIVILALGLAYAWRKKVFEWPS